MECPRCKAVLGQYEILKDRLALSDPHCRDYWTCPSCSQLLRDDPKAEPRPRIRPEPDPNILIQEALVPYLGKEVDEGIKFIGYPIRDLNVETLCKIVNYMAEAVRRIEDDKHKQSLADMEQAVNAAKGN